MADQETETSTEGHGVAIPSGEHLLRQASERELILMPRRQFLRTVSGGLVGVLAGGGLATSLVGCGGGSGGGITQPGPNPGGSIDTRSISGSINLNQIGGAGLRVQSAHQTSAAVDNGTFTTRVSTEGTQILVVEDNGGRTRALALSNAGQVGSLVFDASSTALTLVFLTPGLLTTTPSEATRRFDQIRRANSFPALVSFLAANLKSSSLDQLRNNATLENLKDAVATQVLAANGIQNSGAGVLVARPNNPLASFATRFGEGPNTRKEVQLTNSGLRFLRVDRQDLDPTGNQIRATVARDANSNQPLTIVPGATPLSWGSLLTGTVGAPTTVTETINLTSPPGISTLRYYVSGPGRRSLSDPTPSLGYNINTAGAYGCTVVFAALLPIIDLVIGGRDLLQKAHVITVEVWSRIQASVNVRGFSDAVQSGDLRATASALADLTLALFGLFSTYAGIIAESAGITLSAGLTAAGLVLGAAAAAITLINLEALAFSLLRFPALASTELTVSQIDVGVK